MICHLSLIMFISLPLLQFPDRFIHKPSKWKGFFSAGETTLLLRWDLKPTISDLGGLKPHLSIETAHLLT